MNKLLFLTNYYQFLQIIPIKYTLATTNSVLLIEPLLLNTYTINHNNNSLIIFSK